MFIGRERELGALEKAYESNKFEFVVLYGRRRVGKTALISHFIDGKPAIYFMGVESNAKHWRLFSASLRRSVSSWPSTSTPMWPALPRALLLRCSC